MLNEILTKFRLGHAKTEFKERFAESGWRIFQRALVETRRRQQNLISLGHLLNALAIESSDVFDEVMARSEIDSAKAREFIREILESNLQSTWQGVRISPEVTSLLRQAESAAQKAERKIEATDIGNALSKGKLEFPRIVKWKIV